METQLALLPAYLTGHLQVTLTSLICGLALSLPLGILAAKVAWLERPVLAVASVVQTIPSLALLAIMVPLLSWMSAPSIGFLPAFVAMTLYSLLPILRNTVTGISGVDPALREAALGVGMTSRQQLRLVELPLAMPVIVAGVRTSTVWVVGTATLSTPVGATSLGNFIFSGLQTRNNAAVLMGCIAAASLALILDGLVRLLEVGVRDRRRLPLIVASALLGGLTLYAGGSLIAGNQRDDSEVVVVGSKSFTEQYILAEAMATLVEQEVGRPTRMVPSLGSTVAFDALRGGEIDLYVDYSGTIWATIMHHDDIPEDRQELLAEVERYLLEEHGVVTVGALGFENSYALSVRRRDADQLGLQRISDLVPQASRLTVGGDFEVFSRPEWAAVQRVYGLEFADRRSMDPALMYQAIDQGQVDVITAFSTDGRIDALDLVVLEDDRDAIPPYDAIILASPRLAREHPEVIEALRPLVGEVDADLMRQLNGAVDQQGASPAQASRQLTDRLVSRPER